jgi:hypothetical protein
MGVARLSWGRLQLTREVTKFFLSKIRWKAERYKVIVLYAKRKNLPGLSSQVLSGT